MRIISQEGLPEPVNVPYDRVTVRLQKILTEGAEMHKIIAIEGINTYTLGLYTNLDEAETVFETTIISAGRMDKNVLELPKDHYTEEPLVLAPSR